MNTRTANCAYAHAIRVGKAVKEKERHGCLIRLRRNASTCINPLPILVKKRWMNFQTHYKLQTTFSVSTSICAHIKTAKWLRTNAFPAFIASTVDVCAVYTFRRWIYDFDEWIHLICSKIKLNGMEHGEFYEWSIVCMQVNEAAERCGRWTWLGIRRKEMKWNKL